MTFQSLIPNPPSSLSPGSTIGILGGGQLGRMLAMAAARLGYHTHIYCPETDAPAAEVSQSCTIASYDDEAALRAFAAAVDVVTLEFENTPLAALRVLEPLVPVRPSSHALSICQHRVMEKECIRAAHIGTAPFAAARDQAQLNAALKQIGFPAVLKTCRMGYDGKGQAVIRRAEDAAAAWERLKTDDAIVEGFVDFTMEISVIAARSVSGEMSCFPAVQNIHRDHILHQTIVPAPIAPALAEEAERIARALAESLQVVGVLAVEMFVTKDGLLVNEMAPRPHNSGHWTMDACATSQFEQVVRAVCGLPLGSTEILSPCVMTNLIGHEVYDIEHYLGDAAARLHIYGKKEARAGRKMGHVTVLNTDNL